MIDRGNDWIGFWRGGGICPGLVAGAVGVRWGVARPRTAASAKASVAEQAPIPRSLCSSWRQTPPRVMRNRGLAGAMSVVLPLHGFVCALVP